jgi:histidinol-phosphate/aromatic aminotransferase/cobyric acid decarboxylase-like protein
MAEPSDGKLVLSIASSTDREEIYRTRYEIYSTEIQQHPANGNGFLKDEPGMINHYIIAKRGNALVGFISITPPVSGKYSLDKYFDRNSLPFIFTDDLFEIRLLSVISENRKSLAATALMYAAFRWVESHGGKTIVSICRSDLMEMYKAAGMSPLGLSVMSGKVNYLLASASVDHIAEIVKAGKEKYALLEQKISWHLPFLFQSPGDCYHGGAFFTAIGEDLQQLDKAAQIMNADVLDAWYPPSPKVIEAIHQHLPWMIKTSPPTHAAGMIKTISAARNIKETHILPGAGSSDLIFLAFQNLLHKNSRVLILDPCYGEYMHVLEGLVNCHITRFSLSRNDGFVPDMKLLAEEAGKGYDMVVLVNPNSPTGVHISKSEMLNFLSKVPVSTLVWIDETYIEYAGPKESMEIMAAGSENILVCKSMSKIYALSGIRAAYLCGAPHLLERLRLYIPPWSVSLPAQAATIAALNDPEYYFNKIAETHQLRGQLKNELHLAGVEEIIDGIANFLLFYLPSDINAEEFIANCRKENLFLRDVQNMGKNIGVGAVRIAVKDELTNTHMMRIIKNQFLKKRVNGITGKLKEHRSGISP